MSLPALVYWDASAILSALVEDEHTERAQGWIEKEGIHFVSTLAYAKASSGGQGYGISGVNMSVIDVITERRSTRAYLDKPVERETLEKLLSLATQAPSAINLQPWEFVIVSGEEKKRLSKLLVKRMRERNISCGPGAKKPLPEHFVERQRGLLQCMLPNLPEGTRFDDFINEGSCNFYGAPTAIVITLDKAFSNARLTDIGITLGYFVLAAHAMGLGTCPIGLITAFDDDIREQLNISEEKQVVVGIAVGYRDESSPLNESRSDRVPVSDVVKWRE